jgi:hypothetical protein
MIVVIEKASLNTHTSPPTRKPPVHHLKNRHINAKYVEILARANTIIEAQQLTIDELYTATTDSINAAVAVVLMSS